MKTLFIVGGILFHSIFFLISIFLLPGIAPNSFDEFIKDWKDIVEQEFGE